MDWKECIQKRIAKDVKQDKNLIQSLITIAEAKIRSADVLPAEHHIGKITLLYDALREILESIALENGFKIYNHECYSAFLKEILKLSTEADKFDKLRKTRNAINYYGKQVEKEEAKTIIQELKETIKKFHKTSKE